VLVQVKPDPQAEALETAAVGFTGQMLFLLSNQESQGTEEKLHNLITFNLIYLAACISSLYAFL